MISRHLSLSQTHPFRGMGTNLHEAASQQPNVRVVGAGLADVAPLIASVGSERLTKCGTSSKPADRKAHDSIEENHRAWCGSCRDVP